jgi:hypothetical protein
MCFGANLKILVAKRNDTLSEDGQDGPTHNAQVCHYAT